VSPDGEFSGSVIVTYETSVAAKECESSLNGRWFDGKQLECILFLPTRGSFQLQDDESAVASNYRHAEEVKLDIISSVIEVSNDTTSNNIANVELEVDDFLNSLL
jgi:hypothetical protein